MALSYVNRTAKCMSVVIACSKLIILYKKVNSEHLESRHSHGQVNVC